MNIAHMTQDLLHDLGYDNAKEEQKQAVLAKLQEMVDTEILYAVTSRLSDEQIDTIDAALKDTEMSDDERGKKAMELMQKELPGYETIVEEAVTELYKRLRKDAEEVRNFLEAEGKK